MKKCVFLFLVVTFLISCSSQKSSLDSFDKAKEYRFQYLFSFQNEDDESVFSINEKPLAKGNNLNIKVTDNADENMPAVVTIKSQSTNLNNSHQTNFEGILNETLKTGNYIIEVSQIGFDNFKTIISLKENTSTNLNIKLGLGPELLIYQINSKEELSENEISKIKECIKTRRKLSGYSTLVCSDKENFYVNMQM